MKLPGHRSHNGLLALSDGTLITKDLRLEGQGGTTITRLDPDTLELIGSRDTASPTTYGLSWDACLSDGYCWAMDCGDIWSVRRIHETEPNGRFDVPPGNDLSWRLPAPWEGAQRLLRVSLDDPTDLLTIEPFGTPGGGIIAPPVHVPEAVMAIAWDSINSGLAGVSTADGGLMWCGIRTCAPACSPWCSPSRESS